PDAGWVNPEKLCNAAIINQRTIFSTGIISLEKKDGSWSVKDNCGVEIAIAPVVIIANATDAKSFSQCNWLPIEPVRGQITYLPDSDIKTKSIICYDGGYITPEISGVSYVGATFNRGYTHLDVSIDEHKENLDNLKKHFHVKDYIYSKLFGRVS